MWQRARSSQPKVKNLNSKFTVHLRFSETLPYPKTHAHRPVGARPGHLVLRFCNLKTATP